MNPKKTRVIYWDTSALLSALVQDTQSDLALQCAARDNIHIISSLCLAEAYAVLNRLARERHVAKVMIEAAEEVLKTGPWRYLSMNPDMGEIQQLAGTWSLRGANLWHLATAKTLAKELPELMLLTFDNALFAAAQGEGIAHPGQ